MEVFLLKNNRPSPSLNSHTQAIEGGTPLCRNITNQTFTAPLSGDAAPYPSR